MTFSLLPFQVTTNTSAMNLGKKLAILFFFLGFGSAVAQEAEVLLKAHHLKLKEAMLYTYT
jgi:hypothetical protein